MFKRQRRVIKYFVRLKVKKHMGKNWAIRLLGESKLKINVI